jgi:SET domain-containing protein
VDTKNAKASYSSAEDHYVQIGANLYMGHSRKEDDYINHSCDPNCKLVKHNPGTFRLVALRAITEGDEITWDYSTYINEATRARCLKGLTINCNCGALNCRKRVGDFRSLPQETLIAYKKAGMFPDFILKNITI